MLSLATLVGSDTLCTIARHVIHCTVYRCSPRHSTHSVPVLATSSIEQCTKYCHAIHHTVYQASTRHSPKCATVPPWQHINVSSNRTRPHLSDGDKLPVLQTKALEKPKDNLMIVEEEEEEEEEEEKAAAAEVDAAPLPSQSGRTPVPAPAPRTRVHGSGKKSPFNDAQLARLTERFVANHSTPHSDEAGGLYSEHALDRTLHLRPPPRACTKMNIQTKDKSCSDRDLGSSA